MKRIVWEVLPIAGFRGWAVTRKGKQADTFVFKFNAVRFAVKSCNHDWITLHQPSELYIKGRNGQIQDARTYGDDPKASKG